MIKKATFGAGCFWGVEEAFRRVPGVTETAAGYAGGSVENPTYEMVCRKTTGHAEVVQVHYDDSQVSYEELLDVFWNCHNPGQRGRWGSDPKDQYRSVIFFDDPQQEAAARASKTKVETSGRYGGPVETQIEPAPTFYRAEEYHQQYNEKRRSWI